MKIFIFWYKWINIDNYKHLVLYLFELFKVCATRHSTMTPCELTLISMYTHMKVWYNCNHAITLHTATQKVHKILKLPCYISAKCWSNYCCSVSLKKLQMKDLSVFFSWQMTRLKCTINQQTKNPCYTARNPSLFQRWTARKMKRWVAYFRMFKVKTSLI